MYKRQSLYISVKWFKGWSEIKKPTASNSFASLSSNFQSSILLTISSWIFSSSENKSIWFADLFSKIFLLLVIILGIELNNACLLGFILSNAPAFTSPSSWSLLISFGLTLFKKSLIDKNLPFAILSLTIFEIASYPTAFIPPNA